MMTVLAFILGCFTLPQGTCQVTLLVLELHLHRPNILVIAVGEGV